MGEPVASVSSPKATADAPHETSSGGEHRHLGLALAVIATAQLMVVLDAAIVNVALPSVQRALDFSPPNLVWVINAYTLAFGGLLLLGGRTGDLFGRRKMFMIGIGLFAGASFLGGLATTEWWLIGARALQGVGGAIAAPTALSLIASTFPEGRPRNRAMGVYGAMSGAGGAIGVLLGGVLTDTLGWRWVLFVNVPIGLLLLLIAPRVLGETRGRAGKLDLPGAITATAGMSLLVFGLIHAASTSWGNPYTVAALLGGVFLLGIFLIIESRSERALMPLRLFSNRNRSAAYGVMLAIGTAMFSMFYFLTLFMQDVLGYSPLKAGFAYLPFAVMIILSATFTARLVGRIGVKGPLMIGTLIGSVGLAWLSLVTPQSAYFPDVFIPMLLMPAGVAMCFVPLTLTAVAGVRREEQGIASALLNSGQQVGGSLGLAVLGTIAITVTRNQVGGVVDRFGSHAGRLFGAEPPPPHSHLPPALRDAVAAAYTHGYTTALRVGAAILVFAFLVIVLAIQTPKSAKTTPGGQRAGRTETAPGDQRAGQPAPAWSETSN